MKRFGLLAVVVLLVACGKKEDASATAAAASASASAAVASAAPSVAAVDTLPSEEDFEEEAEKDITVTNVKDELAKLEKQIP